MDDGVTKRIVVLKNLPSNIIEEAILILKADPGHKENFRSKEKEGYKAASDSNFLLKEAHMIINNYIKQNSLQTTPIKETKGPPIIKNRRFLVNSIINIALVGSIAVLILMIVKLI